MPDPIHLKLDRLGDVVTDEFEPGMTNPAGDVGLTPCEVVVEADHLITGLHQTVDQVGAKEAGTASDEVDLHPQGVSSFSTIAATGASATVASSACCCNGFKRTWPLLTSSSPKTRAH